jgi:beta-lactam-binding protein with PASTA domain
LGNTQFDVPAVTGLSVDEAMTILNQYNLQVVIVPNDQMSAITDTASATVVDQEPRDKSDAGATNRIKEGDIIDLKIEQNPPPEDIHGNNISRTKNVNDK